MENFKVKDLKALAKEKGIKGYYRMRKAELIKLIEETDLIEFDSIETYDKKCSHKIREKSCKHCGICIHNRVKYTCKECGGKGICQHDKQKRFCKECGGKGICPHGKDKSYCKECGGSQICPHSRQKRQCKDCGGKGICQHGKQKYHCKECNAPFPATATQ